MSDSEDPLEAVDDGGEDLFGDEGDEDLASPKERVLADDELASDLDEDPDARNRGYDDDDDAQPQETRDRIVMAVQTYRHQIPNPKDGTVSNWLLPFCTVDFPQANAVH